MQVLAAANDALRGPREVGGTNDVTVSNGVNLVDPPRPSRSAWAETLQTHGFPIQTYGKTLKGRNFNSKA